jgi:hypothetical protein
VNVLAIISLIGSLLGVLFILPLIGSVGGVITGHLSLAQIKQTGERGRGMAVAGLIIGYVGVGFILLGLITLFAFLPFMFASVGTLS